MEIGASSACFYPLETEKSFQNIAQLGFKCSEIFFNAPSELKKNFIKELKKIKDANEIDVVSLHPYRSFSEGYDLFSSYKRRYTDAVEKFKRYFDAAGELGAKYIVIHGSKFGFDIPAEEYAERFGKLNEIAKLHGCTVAHENVVNCAGALPDFMTFMRKHLGDEFKMVLDVKQAKRARVAPWDFIDAMGSNIVHVHLSDYFNKENDCVPPSEKGEFDFEKLFTLLQNAGYSGKYIVELYSDSFENQSEIVNSALYLETILNKVRQGDI